MYGGGGRDGKLQGEERGISWEYTSYKSALHITIPTFSILVATSAGTF